MKVLVKLEPRIVRMANAREKQGIDKIPWKHGNLFKIQIVRFVINLYVMEMLTTLFRAKLTTGLADFGLQQML